jgi:hypothetical protein
MTPSIPSNPSPLPEKASEIKTRILLGETVPLDELISFLKQTEFSLSAERKIREKPTKADDVDFF